MPNHLPKERSGKQRNFHTQFLYKDVLFTYLHQCFLQSGVYAFCILTFAAKWMELVIIMLSEKSHTQKDKYCRFSCIYGSLKQQSTWTQNSYHQRLGSREYKEVGLTNTKTLSERSNKFQCSIAQLDDYSSQ